MVKTLVFDTNMRRFESFYPKNINNFDTYYSFLLIMKILQLKPNTNGTRHIIKIQKNLLAKTNKLSKKTIVGSKRFFGRSSITGRITVWHKGGGCKKLFRKIDYSNVEKNGIVVCIMYDPFRSSFVSLNFDLDNFNFFRTISTNFVYPGSLFCCSKTKNDLKLGNRIQLINIPAGSIIHSLSLDSQEKTSFARSAGTFCQIIQKSSNFCKIKLPSGFVINCSSSSFATLGSVSNFQHNLIHIGKAGKNRLMGKRPIVRGIAMNPVDHPHGGRTNGGMPSVTPWGIPTKGKPTVKKSYE